MCAIKSQAKLFDNGSDALLCKHYCSYGLAAKRSCLWVGLYTYQSVTVAAPSKLLLLCQDVTDRRAEVKKYSSDKEYKRRVDDERRNKKPKKEDPGLSGIIIPLPPFGNSEMDGGKHLPGEQCYPVCS